MIGWVKNSSYKEKLYGLSDLLSTCMVTCIVICMVILVAMVSELDIGSL